MNSYFEGPDGVVGVTHPDKISRPRAPIIDTTTTYVGPIEPDPVLLEWFPIHPTILATRRPVHPDWIGTFSAALWPAISPVDWLPTRTGYLGAPRLHRTFYPSHFMPPDVNDLVVAARMGWDTKQKSRLVTRARLRETTAFFFVPPTTISGGALTCTAISDLDLTSPAIIAQAMTSPRFINEALTTPALINEGLC